ncbi:MAG: hypothetical protein AAF361_13345, partial [Bacteroidota bacterium]
MKNEKGQSPKDKSAPSDHLAQSRRQALKRILGSTAVLFGMPLGTKSWGQPSSPFNDPTVSSTRNFVSSGAPTIMHSNTTMPYHGGTYGTASVKYASNTTYQATTQFFQLAPTTAPTTKAPTTKAPTTKAPTTKAPTTKAPTTKAPTTKAPTTKAPTTKAPTTKAPTTKAPTTKAPTTKAP